MRTGRSSSDGHAPVAGSANRFFVCKCDERKETMTDELRLGTLGDEILRAGPSASPGDAVLNGGLSIPTPRQGPVPIFAATDDLPAPPHPFHGGDLMILHGGLSIPTP
jgi:hypothetical protein